MGLKISEKIQKLASLEVRTIRVPSFCIFDIRTEILPPPPPP